MILTTTETVAGHRVTETLGIVKGSTVRAKHAGRDFMAGLKSIVGGEIKGYTEMLAESRTQAEERLMGEARQLGADAVVNIRYTTSAVMQGMSEMLAYGTAVRIQPD
jgi:uncharacterized protein YbjQ (UPF0145 family)